MLATSCSARSTVAQGAQSKAAPWVSTQASANPAGIRCPPYDSVR